MVTNFKTGISKGENGYVAANSAVRLAKEKFGDGNVDFCIVYSSLNYHLDDVYNGIKDVIGEVPLIGSSSAGEFTEEISLEGGVVVTLISSDTHKFFSVSADDLKDNIYEKINELVKSLPKEVEGYPYLSAIVLHDGLIGKGERIMSELIQSFPSTMRFAGGTAGDDLKFKATYVMHNNKVINNGIVLTLIASKKKIGMGVKHGHVPITDKLTVTKSKGNVLYRINRKPAWDVWREELKDKAMKNEGIDVYSLKDSSEIGSFLLKYEMGLSLGNDKYKVRVPLSVNEDGSINFAVEIFEGSKFNIMHSIKNKQIESAEEAAFLAMENLGEEKVAGSLIFDCVCRGLILKDDFKVAIEKVSNVIGSKVPIAGFETYGEICKEKSQFSGFHNTTSVIVIFPD